MALGKVPWWTVVVIAALDMGAAFFALVWFLAGIGDIPFAAPWPPAFLIVGAIAAFTAAANVAIWWAVTRVARSGPAPPWGP